MVYINDKEVSKKELNRISKRIVENTETIEKSQDIETIENQKKTENNEALEKYPESDDNNGNEENADTTNNISEKSFEESVNNDNIVSDVFEKNEEESHKCESSDNGTEELKVDTDNFSGISKEFVQENPEIEIKSDEKTDDETENDSNNDETTENAKEKKEKKIELPSFMR